MECICARRNFVVDNTNPTMLDRARYIAPAREAGYRVVGYFFQSKIHDCIRRNELREGKSRVPSKAIVATSNKMELPDYEEGFDKLYFVSIDETGDDATGNKQTTTSEWRKENEL